MATEAPWQKGKKEGYLGKEGGKWRYCPRILLTEESRHSIIHVSACVVERKGRKDQPLQVRELKLRRVLHREEGPLLGGSGGTPGGGERPQVFQGEESQIWRAANSDGRSREGEIDGQYHLPLFRIGGHRLHQGIRNSLRLSLLQKSALV